MKLSGPRGDSLALFLLDTGAGYPALDRSLARRIGFTTRDFGNRSMELLVEPIPRLALGSLTMDQVAPALALDLSDLSAAVDEPLAGLLGASLFERDALVLEDSLALVILARGGSGTGERAVDRSRSRLATVIDSRARALPVRVIADGKVMVRVSLEGAKAPLELVLDTGATKTVFFASALERAGRPQRAWRQVHGLGSPTLYGQAPFTLTRVPRMILSTMGATTRVEGLDAGIVRGGLADEMARVLGPDVAGLLGGSFLRRFRVVLDLRERVLWLSPRAVSRDQRPHEVSGPGLQLARKDGVTTVVGVVTASPAARAGIRSGDILVRVDGRRADALSLEALGRALEGPAGTRLRIELRRGARERSINVRRERYL